MRCLACHHDNPEGVKFCGECGAKLECRCPSCGAPNPPGNKFCYECGESLREGRHRTITPVPGLAGERCYATIVFSDLAGYTAMNERLDPEEVEALLGRIKDAAVAIVERHGGIVNQFVGDEVLALFGIPRAHEDDPVRAVRAAVEVHEMVRAMSPEVEQRIAQPLRMHTGIHTGLIVTNQRDDRDGRFGIVGNTVNLGSRLKAMSTADDILVSPETRSLITPFFEIEALPALRIKGKSEPLVPYRVLGPSKARTRFEAAARRGLAPHIGRARELTALRQALAHARAGHGRLITVAGEAGLGKSRLLYELRLGLEEEGFAVLQGSCQSYGSSTSYLPFLEALHALLDLREDDEPARLVDKTAARVRAIDAALVEHLPLYLHLLSLRSEAHPLAEHLTGEALTRAAEEALAALFMASARRRPGLLLLEDWHWTDEASASALLHLIDRVAGAPLLVVVTHRPDRPASWPESAHHAHLELRPLSAPDTQALVASQVSASEVPEALAGVVHERTGGNPFFVEELCRSLVEEGALAVQRGRADLTRPIEDLLLPSTVQAIIRTRLDRLEPEAKEVLRLASVIGKRFGRRLLARLHEDPRRLDPALERLVALDLLQEIRSGREREYMFRQALTQEVAYESLRLGQRKRLHALVGGAVEGLFAARLEEHVNLLQYHFSRAEDWPKAIDYGRRAAERAAALSRFQEAIGILEEVVSWIGRLPAAPARAATLIEVLLHQERLYETLGRRRDQQAVIDRLFALLEPASGAVDDAGRLADIHVRQGDLYTQLGRFEDAERALGEALRRREALDDEAGQAHVLRSMGFLRWHQGRYQEAVAYNEAALAIDHRRDDGSAAAMDLTNLGAVLRNIGDHARALQCLNQALDLYEAAGRPARQAFTLYSIANINRELGVLELAMDQYRRAYDIFSEHRDHVMASRALAAIAGICWDRGDAEESIRLCREVVDMTREAAYGHGLSHALRTLAERLSARGEHVAAVPHLLEGAAVFAKLGERRNEAEMWERLATAYEQHLDAPDQAVAAWDSARALRLQANDRTGALQALQEMARLARERLGRMTEALEHLTDALDLAADLGDLGKQGEIRNAMGILAWRGRSYEQALGHYEHARECYREIGAAAHEGFILNSIGVTLHKLGRMDEALARLDEAASLHRECGEHLLEGHALAAMGDIHRERGELDQALQSYQASLDLRRAIDDRRGQGWMHCALAQAHEARGADRQARDHADAARAVAEELGDEELRQALEDV